MAPDQDCVQSMYIVNARILMTTEQLEATKLSDSDQMRKSSGNNNSDRMTNSYTGYSTCYSC